MWHIQASVYRGWHSIIPSWSRSYWGKNWTVIILATYGHPHLQLPVLRSSENISSQGLISANMMKATMIELCAFCIDVTVWVQPNSRIYKDLEFLWQECHFLNDKHCLIRSFCPSVFIMLSLRVTGTNTSQLKTHPFMRCPEITRILSMLKWNHIPYLCVCVSVCKCTRST